MGFFEPLCVISVDDLSQNVVIKWHGCDAQLITVNDANAVARAISGACEQIRREQTSRAVT